MADDISPEDLDRDLGSATYTRIYEALTRFEQMAERNALLGFYPSLTADTFEGMDRIDDALVSLAINLIYRRIGFDPEFTMEKRAREILDINLRFGSHFASFQHALLVKISNFPGLEAREAMTALCARGISGEHEKKAAKWLVSYLMDHEETRPTVVQFLGRMKDRDDLEPVVDYVRPTLTPEERENLDEW
ncbi:hypothetical protein AB0M75_18780 [Streptomyces anulatus]|uniref:hypothetical protein n=1 Tax=Streptomyces anulatus TaxID=1892 RepID=UPI003425B358